MGKVLDSTAGQQQQSSFFASRLELKSQIKLHSILHMSALQCHAEWWLALYFYWKKAQNKEQEVLHVIAKV